MNIGKLNIVSGRFINATQFSCDMDIDINTIAMVVVNETVLPLKRFTAAAVGR